MLHAYPDRFTHEFFIGSAHPDRTTVERVWKLLRSQAVRCGFVALTVGALAEHLPPALGERKVGAALRVLMAAGACSEEAAALGRVSVRLLAAPARIVGELTGDRTFDREVLRAMWRAVGKKLELGASIDLDGLPPELGGALGLVPVLQRLQAQQFVTWVRTGGGIRLDPRARAAKSLPLDWAAMDKRRKSDMSRLEAMQRYAQTRHCRRAFVLRYFGDPEVRSQCAACDRCLGTTEVLPPADTTLSVRARSRPL